MKRHALFVGVSDYTDPTIQNLDFPVEDAVELASVFLRLLKFDRVQKLTNPDHSPKVVDTIKDMTRGLGPGDLFLFFFAGHGFRVKDNHVLVCTNDEYVDLEDEEAGLSVWRLKKHMRGAWNRMIVLDACQSDIRATRGADRGVNARDLELIHSVDADASDSGLQIVVTSCSEGQKAIEVADLRHGLFTSAFLDSVTAFADTRSRINLETLRTDIGGRMGGLISKYRLSGRQEPMFTMPTDAGGIVLLDGKEAAPLSPNQPSPPTVSPVVSAESAWASAADKQPPAKPTAQMRSYELAVSNWTVKMEVDLPGCGEKQFMFTLFETLSKYLCLLQGLGKHGEGKSATAFGCESFRDSVWRLVSGPNKSAIVKFPILTEEDDRAIANAGGMEEFARQKGAWPIFKELEVELSVLCEDLRRNCKGNRSARNALALAKELSKSLKNQGEV